MFGKSKNQKEIEKLRKEKEELLMIKEMLEDKSPKVDVSDVYVWEYNGISYLVRCYVKTMVGNALGGVGPIRNGFESTLIDIFSEQLVYKKCSTQLIKEKELVKDVYGKYTDKCASFRHILEVDKSLLVYADKRVPKYVLQQDYYLLNNIDITKTKGLNKGK